MKQPYLLTFALCSTTLLGCATATYTPPGGISPDHERVVKKPFDDTWSMLIDHVSKSFFAIDRFEKASGLMTLTFGSSEPWVYIDCGHFRGEALGGAHTVDQSYAAFLADRHRAALQGKMNIVVRQIDARSTAVRVSARYIFTTPATQASPAQTWSFDSGQHATVTVHNPTAGTPATRTCRPTYTAERTILDAIKD